MPELSDITPLRSASDRRSSQEPIIVDGQRLAPSQVVELLRPFLTEARQQRIDEVIAGRTFTVAPVVEGLVNMGNVSAVMRSAEALGFQSFHVVTDGNRFKNSPRTTQGADKWLDVQLWETPRDCVSHLKDAGYKVVVTHLDETAVPLEAIDFTEKTALVFGNEAEGVSPEMLSLSDQRCIIPMAGFVQSFNISVAAAISLYHAYHDRFLRQGHHGDLTDSQREMLRATFYLRSVNKGSEILQKEVASMSAPRSGQESAR